MRKIVSSLAVAAVVLAPGAALAAHGRPGLWTVTATMTSPTMPAIPPETLAMLKARHMNVPLPGQPFTTQMCMTQQQVNMDRPPDMQRDGENCTTRVLSQSASQMNAQTSCHGHLEGTGHLQMAWRGNTHYEGVNSFKGSMEGRAQEMTTHFSGDFVKADCGSVKPFAAPPH